VPKSGIYQIRNLINNKVYIGSAVNFSARRSRHFKELKGNTHHSILLQNSFNKHGIDNFVFEILEIVEDKFKLIEREQFYFNTLKPQFNICQIAGSCLGIKRSRELVERLTAQKRGKKVFWPKEVRENAIKKMRQTLKYNPSILRDRNKKKWKSVVQLDLQGNLIAIFDSLKEASNQTGIHISHINATCLDKQKTTKGCTWLYEKDYLQNNNLSQERLSEKNKNRIAVLQMNVVGQLIKEYSSIKEASLQNNIHSMQIVNICKNKPRCKTAGGFKWMYKDKYKLL